MNKFIIYSDFDGTISKYDTLDKMDLVWYPTNHKELHF